MLEERDAIVREHVETAVTRAKSTLDPSGANRAREIVRRSRQVLK